MTERVDSVGNLEDNESSSVGSSVETSSEDSEEEEADPRVKEEVGSRNDGIFISIEIHYMCRLGHKYSVVNVWHLILFTSIHVY